MKTAQIESVLYLVCIQYRPSGTSLMIRSMMPLNIIEQKRKMGLGAWFTSSQVAMYITMSMAAEMKQLM